MDKSSAAIARPLVEMPAVPMFVALVGIGLV
jgi:hypothetical protein